MSKHPLYNTTGLIRNNQPHVMYALANKQMELKEFILEYELKVIKAKSSLEALEQTICLFDDNCDETINKLDKKVQKSKSRARNIFFKSGEATKMILKILRVANMKLSFNEIFQKVWDIKSKDVDISQKYKLEKSISVSLNSIRKKDLIVRSTIDNRVLWSIK